MSEHEVYIEWGPFMNSCYISIMEGETFGPTLQISDDMFSDKKTKACDLMPKLTKYDKKRIFLREILSLLPSKNSISWKDELRGDSLLGYEIHGTGDGFRAWIKGGAEGTMQELDPAQKEELRLKLLEAQRTFFP